MDINELNRQHMEFFAQLKKINRYVDDFEGKSFVGGNSAGLQGHLYLSEDLRQYTSSKIFDGHLYEIRAVGVFYMMAGTTGRPQSLRDIRGLTLYLTDGIEHEKLDFTDLLLPLDDSPSSVFNLARRLSFSRQPDAEDRGWIWEHLLDYPDSLPGILELYSDRGTVNSFVGSLMRSLFVYRWQKERDRNMIRYRLSPEESVPGINKSESEFLAGYNPKCCTQDLCRRLEDSGKIEYQLQIQIISEKNIPSTGINIRSVSQIWPESLFPCVTIGKVVFDELFDYRKAGAIEETTECQSEIVSNFSGYFLSYLLDSMRRC